MFVIGKVGTGVLKPMCRATHADGGAKSSADRVSHKTNHQCLTRLGVHTQQSSHNEEATKSADRHDVRMKKQLSTSKLMQTSAAATHARTMVTPVNASVRLLQDQLPGTKCKPRSCSLHTSASVS